MATRVNNLDVEVETPLKSLMESLSTLQPGQKIYCNNTKGEILKTRENLTRRRAEIPGADSHLDYIEALLVAEANQQLDFRK